MIFSTCVGGGMRGEQAEVRGLGSSEREWGGRGEDEERGEEEGERRNVTFKDEAM